MVSHSWKVGKEDVREAEEAPNITTLDLERENFIRHCLPQTVQMFSAVRREEMKSLLTLVARTLGIGPVGLFCSMLRRPTSSGIKTRSSANASTIHFVSFVIRRRRSLMKTRKRIGAKTEP